MNAPEYVAALKALQAGLVEQIARAEQVVLQDAAASGVERYSTPYGPIVIAQKGAEVVVTDTPAFTEWCEANLPDAIETVRRVRPQTAKAALARLTVMRGQVFDTTTGEEVPWAGLSDPGRPYVSWPASAAQKETKDMARLLFEDRALGLTVGLRELTGGTAA